MSIANFFNKNFKTVLSILFIIVTLCVVYFFVYRLIIEDGPYRECIELAERVSNNRKEIIKKIEERGDNPEDNEIIIYNDLLDEKERCFKVFRN